MRGNFTILPMFSSNPPFQARSNGIRVSPGADVTGFPRVPKKYRDLKMGMDPFGHAPNRLPVSERTRNQIFPVKTRFLQIFYISRPPILVDLQTIWSSFSMTRSRNHLKKKWNNNKSASLNAVFDRFGITSKLKAWDDRKKKSGMVRIPGST